MKWIVIGKFIIGCLNLSCERLWKTTVGTGLYKVSVQLVWNHINEEVISDLYSYTYCCQLKLVADETAGMKKTVPDESTGMKQTIKLIRGST